MHREIHEEMRNAFEEIYKNGWFIGGEPCEKFEKTLQVMWMHLVV